MSRICLIKKHDCWHCCLSVGMLLARDRAKVVNLQALMGSSLPGVTHTKLWSLAEVDLTKEVYYSSTS